MNFFSSIIDSVVGFYNLVLSFFQWILDVFYDFCHWITGIFQDLITLFCDWFFPLVDSLIGSVVDLVPDLSSFWGRHTAVSQSLYLAYQFFAFRECFLIFLSLLTFVFVFIVVKFIIKLIPTVG